MHQRCLASSFSTMMNMCWTYQYDRYDKASLNGLSYNQKLNLKFLHCLRQTKQQELFKPDAGAGQLEIRHHVPGEGHAGQWSRVHLTRIRQVGCEMLWWLLKVFGFMKPGLICPWHAYCSPLSFRPSGHFLCDIFSFFAATGENWDHMAKKEMIINPKYALTKINQLIHTICAFSKVRDLWSPA